MWVACVFSDRDSGYTSEGQRFCLFNREPSLVPCFGPGFRDRYWESPHGQIRILPEYYDLFKDKVTYSGGPKQVKLVLDDINPMFFIQKELDCTDRFNIWIDTAPMYWLHSVLEKRPGFHIFKRYKKFVYGTYSVDHYIRLPSRLFPEVEPDGAIHGISIKLCG